MSTLLLGKSKPIGEIQDFKYRIKFQQRGSPHCHMLLWVKNIPSISQNSPEDVAAFIDQYVGCTIPQDNHLASLIQSVQRHIHSFTCKTHGTRCRFSFPKPPVHKTTVVLPPEDIPNKGTQTGQPAVLYRCNPSNCLINNYSPTLMKAWQANLDLQFVTNVYACIMYVASYVSKSEKILGGVLKFKNSAPAGPKKMMETVSKKFRSHREVSAQEAV